MSMAGTRAQPVLRVAIDRPVTIPISNHKALRSVLRDARASAKIVNRINKCSENKVGSQYKAIGLNIIMAAASVDVVAENPSRTNQIMATPAPAPRNNAFIMNAAC